MSNLVSNCKVPLNLDAHPISSVASPSVEVKRFSVQVNKSETSGLIVDQFNAGAKPAVVLGLSPTSSSTNRARLRAILEWLLPRVENITVLDGCWFHRWDLVVFDRIPIENATEQTLHEMRRLHRRIRDVAAELGATNKVNIVTWPETHTLGKMSSIRDDLMKAAERCPKLADALQAAVTEYLIGLSDHVQKGLRTDDIVALRNYVIEEVSTLVHLSLLVSPLEVYPGPDLPLMRRLATGEFHEFFPYDLSLRSHLSLELIELSAGKLREGTSSDWPEIERIIRAWPTHFVEKVIPLVREDFFRHQTILCANSKGQLLGFSIWRTDGCELELLWIAVEPSQVGIGIGRSIVQAVLCQRSHEHRVFLRTATTDSIIPDTSFNGAAYEATHRFFQNLGFIFGARHEGYWGAQNHMIEFEKIYDL